jgi:hypothetical protein
MEERRWRCGRKGYEGETMEEVPAGGFSAVRLSGSRDVRRGCQEGKEGWKWSES